MLKSLKIGAITYTVNTVDDLHRLDADGRKQWLHGHILHADAEIRIANDQAAEVKVATLWHEAVHGILNQAGIDEHPEQIVIALGYGLMQLIRNNPELVTLTQCGEPVTSGVLSGDQYSK